MTPTNTLTASPATDAVSALDIASIRRQFPILERTVNGKPLVYLDNAATSQKPEAVIACLDTYWREFNANIHRGVHLLSQEATEAFDSARLKVQALLGAASPDEVVFTKGCTEGINLVAAGLARSGQFGHGDRILLSHMEHHSNIVPWQLAAESVGARVEHIPITDVGEVDQQAYAQLLSQGQVKVVGVVHVSNSLGTINPIQEMAQLAHEAGALVLVDGAQAGPHLRINVQTLGADFYTLSCHKIYAPTGVGVLYGKLELLNSLPPYQGGGDMIRTVSFEGSTYKDAPGRFESGTPNIAGVIGLAAAIEWIASLGSLSPQANLVSRLDAAFRLLEKREASLTQYGMASLGEIPGVRLKGTAKHKAGVLAFVLDGAHPHDIGTILDGYGVAIRAGHHCCMPLMKRLGVPATARASLAVYNTEQDVDALVEGIGHVKEILGC